MEKYLGNKSSLLPLIENFLNEYVPEAHAISDPFAGTTNVSRYFRARGWNTACADTNRFTYVLARTYLGLRSPPEFNKVLQTIPTGVAHNNELQKDFVRTVQRHGHLYAPDQSAAELLPVMENLATVLSQLQKIGETALRGGPITEYFTQYGSRSEFRSVRGGTGKRNYFSLENARFLDAVLETVRCWWREGHLSLDEVFALLTAIIEEVVITANVNGTFHDFNRNRIWPNAQQRFLLRIPLITFEAAASEIANLDALEAGRWFESHDVCYLDPPYNFRQYSAYYHFLNFVAAFPFLQDVTAYLEAITHVRGQHPADNVNSDFCYRDRFISSLRALISNTHSDHVVLSYYGGRNHWNHWSKVDAPTDRGLKELRALFEDSELFASAEVIPALDLRQNYQSRVGEQKEFVNEYLFYGRRAKRRMRSLEESKPLDVNVKFGLDGVYTAFRSMPQPQELMVA